MKVWSIIFVFLLFATQAKLASADDDRHDIRSLVIAETILPLDQVLSLLQQHKPGRILELELEHEHGRYIYEFELLDERGMVWEIEVDAQTGQLLEMEQED